MHRLPLAAVRVLDLGMAGPAAYCARLLGDMGAEVIGVEWERGYEKTPSLDQANRNKLGCALDLSRPRGHDLLLRLVMKSNVVVEGLEDSEKERLGLTYKALPAACPDVIVASVTGRQESAAREASISLGDILAGTAAAGAVCAALLHHRRTGEGQQIEVDARDCVLSFLGDFVVAQGMGHSPSARVTIALPSPDDLLSDAHLRERRFFESVSDPQMGVQEMASLPWRFSRTPGHVRLPAPSPGQHNGYVFGEILGLSPQEMADLEQKGVIGTPASLGQRQ